MRHRATCWLHAVFDGDAKTAGAANNHVLAWVLLGMVTPGLVVLALAVPAISGLVWIATCGARPSALTLLLVATRRGFVTQAAVVFLVGVWALFTWAAWMSGGLFSAAICAQFLLVALAEATHGWRWALSASALSLTTVIGFAWARGARSASPFSTVITTPTSYAAVVIACLLALAITHGLLVARTRWAGDRIVRELQQATVAEQRLRDLIDNAPFGAFLCELQGGRQVAGHARESQSRVSLSARTRRSSSVATWVRRSLRRQVTI